MTLHFSDKWVCRNLEKTPTFSQSISATLNWNLLTGRARGYFRNFISLICNAWYFTTTANFSFLPFYYLLQPDTNNLVFNVLGLIKEKEKNKSKLEIINSRKGDRERSLTYNTQIQSSEYISQWYHCCQQKVNFM